MMSSCRLIVFRHGETEWNQEGRLQGRTDVPLSSYGRLQCIERAEQLRKQLPTIDCVYASTLTRAYCSAILLHSGLRLECPVIRNQDLVEWNAGHLEGLKIKDIDPAEFTKGPDYDYQGGESIRERHKRIVKALKEIGKKHCGGQVLVVSHGAVMGDMLKECLGLGPEVRFPVPKKNMSMNVVEYDCESDELKLLHCDGVSVASLEARSKALNQEQSSDPPPPPPPQEEDYLTAIA